MQKKIKSLLIIFVLTFHFFSGNIFSQEISTSSAQREVEIATESSRIIPPSNNQSPNKITSLTVMPPKIGDDFSLILKPGQKKEVLIELRNPSNEYLKIESFVKDLMIASDGQTPVPVDEDINSKFSLAKWINLKPTNQVLAPQTLTEVKVLIEVPVDAVAGGRYAMVLHRPNTDNEIKNGVAIMPQIGTLLYVIVDGNIKGEAKINSFNFDSVEFGPVDYQLSIKNDSPTHIRPKISYEINNLFGKKIGFLKEKEKNIFPGVIAQYEGQFPKVWGFGLYKANVLVEYQLGDELKNISEQTDFWILPIRLILVALVFTILLIFLLRAIFRKYRNYYVSHKETIAKLNEQIEKLKKDKENK